MDWYLGEQRLSVGKVAFPVGSPCSLRILLSAKYGTDVSRCHE